MRQTSIITIKKLNYFTDVEQAKFTSVSICEITRQCKYTLVSEGAILICFQMGMNLEAFYL